MDSKYQCRSCLPVIWAIAVLICQPSFLRAEIYKYKQNGIWHYSDTLPSEAPDSNLEVLKNTPSKSKTPPEAPLLLADFQARSPIERATAATVAIQTTVGSGSGFFITSDGHIITNKHVIRITESQTAKIQSAIEQSENRLQAIDQQLENERQQLKHFKERLDALHGEIELETDTQRKMALQANYEENRQRYLIRQKDHQKRYQTFVGQRKKFDDQRQSYKYSQSLAGLSRHFTVILADKSEHYVYLIAVSPAHDLALLKLDGFRTPVLEPGEIHALVQGEPVYAIGSPVGLQNSVTSGIFSGFQKGFLQTNAQIYPGNSGGPLVSANGRVLGINTFKKLTHKFEGLGFAIPISTVWEEFSEFLASP